MTGDGIPSLWEHVLDHRQKLTASGELAARRGEQESEMDVVDAGGAPFAPLRSERSLKAALPRIEAEVAAGRLSVANAAVEQIIGLLHK